MLSETGQIIVIGLVALLGISAVIASISLLRRGKLYHRLKPQARPRRWVLISVLVLFAVFVVWFPVWIIWPDLLISRILTMLFGITFAAVGLSLKWFSGVIDHIVKRKGWQLR